MGKIAAFTIVRHDRTMLEIWVKYYGRLLGYENLFVIFEGDDWEHPPLHPDIKQELVKIAPKSRVQLDMWFAEYASKFASALLQDYDCVIRADVDEFIILDPDVTESFDHYLMGLARLEVVSALGVDVIQHRRKEPPLDLDQPSILSQRRHAIVTREFSKPCIIFKEIAWAEGCHRVHYEEIRFDSNLYMFHFALIDEGIATTRIKDRQSASHGAELDAHIMSRMKRFEEVETAPRYLGDDVFGRARAQIGAPKPGGGKRVRPAPITENNNVERGYLIEIPQRFASAL